MITRALLIFPRRIERNLQRVRDARLVDPVPNLWQLAMGVVRMYRRLVLRPDTIGTCRAHAVRDTWRARALQYRPLRFPFLVAERAIAPLDLTGLASPPERLMRHLLGAHHDGNQFVFDLQILQCYPGALRELQRRVDSLVADDSSRSRWLRDLTVFEGYHESLKAAVDRAVAEGVRLAPDEADDPDLSFEGYLRWCARQPATPADTLRAWRRGELDFAEPAPC